MKFKIIFILIFISSFLTANLIINKFDKYEKSTDGKSNHALIKGDVHKFWVEADKIKKNFQEDKPIYDFGGVFWNSYLPPKFIAFFYIVADEDLYTDKVTPDNKPQVKSGNKKIYFICLQIFFFFVSIYLLYKCLKIQHNKIALITITILLIEPTINQYHYSFLSESIFFSLTIILLSQILKNSNSKITALNIGLIVGILYLQRSIAIFYFLPILIYFILERKKFAFMFSYLIGLILILTFLGLHNFLRSDVFYVTPIQSKVDLYRYLIPNILNKKNVNQSKIELENFEKQFQNFKLQNKINMKSEKDLIKYSKYVQKESINYILQNPLSTVKIIFKKSLHSLVFNPFEIYAFYKYEYKPSNKKKYEYYKSDEHKKNVKIRIFYSSIIYLICLMGFFHLLKNRANYNFIIFLILSVLYFTFFGGWQGNPRYLAPNMIFLSIFFSYGILEIKKQFEFLRS
tara:strand:+ start:774 stop:2150 length:1377 start_codon:yes stop_codon:yes gene_type:complete